jgi:mono/diheme cytochrome c family protein
MSPTHSSVFRGCESRHATAPCQRSRPLAVRATPVLRPAALVVCLALGLTVGICLSTVADEPVPVPRSPSPAQPSTDRTTSAPVTPAQAYQTLCIRCHDANGGGARLRRLMPELPNFTDPRWQDSRTDADLDRLIRVGTGKWMRPMAARLGSVEVKQMVAYIRTFRDGRQQASNDPGTQPRK